MAAAALAAGLDRVPLTRASIGRDGCSAAKNEMTTCTWSEGGVAVLDSEAAGSTATPVWTGTHPAGVNAREAIDEMLFRLTVPRDAAD